ncbi:MAG: alpha-glucosidase [Rickettsiales bacterium]|nr:alpha-glucosidase [Rickettsiales bacterium]
MNYWSFKSTTNWLHVFGLLLLVLVSSCQSTPRPVKISSPDGNITTSFFLSESGEPLYSVQLKGKTVIEPSRVGVIADKYSFEGQLSIVTVSTLEKKAESYRMHQGKQLDIVYDYQEQTVVLSNTKGQQLSIVFRVSNDGVAFRYKFPKESESTIANELTEFQFPINTEMYAQPMSVAKTGWEQTNPSYEEPYERGIAVGTVSPLGAGWVFPTLFKVDMDWVLITESGLGPDYCGGRLVSDTVSKAMKVGFPSDVEVYTDKGHLPFNASLSPWRILTIGSLETIVESTLGTDLAEPAIQLSNEEFINPGIASWSWALLKDRSVNYETSKEFIEYASEMNWKYCLIDVNWDTTIGEEGMKELVAYADDRNVGLILWYNSAGEWNTTPYHPKSKLLTHEQREVEFSKLKEWGIKGVKIDFFGGDGQSMIAYYHDMLRDAGKHELLVNFHGATLPRGWQRTYPHLMTVEAIKGFEFITFFQETADDEPAHAATLPYTRNAFDPMDFTPMAFSQIPNIERKSTNAFELALPTLFLSGIQHLAEVPEGMSAVPDYVRAYLSDIPTAWDETQFIDGFPGKLAVIARRSGNTWFVTGINGEGIDKEVQLDLSFLNGKSGYLITDGDAHPEFRQEEIEITDTYTIALKANGGFVMKVQ